MTQYAVPFRTSNPKTVRMFLSFSLGGANSMKNMKLKGASYLGGVRMTQFFHNLGWLIVVSVRQVES